MMSDVTLMGRRAARIMAIFSRYSSRVYVRCIARRIRVDPDCTGQVDVIAQLGHGIDGLDDVPAEISRMGRREAHAANSRHRSHRHQKLRETHPLAVSRASGSLIGVDRLPEKLNFRIARVGQFANLFQNRRARAAALRPSRVRDDAVGAGLVAAFDDGQVGAKRIVAPGHFRLERFVGIGVEAHHAAISRFEFRDEFRQLAVTRRAADQTHPGRALEDFFAFLLRDAAQNADDFPVAGMLPECSQARENFLRGLFADAARVVEHQLCRVDALASAGIRGRAELRQLSRSHDRSSGSRTSQYRTCALLPPARRDHTRTARQIRGERGQIVKANIECLRHRSLIQIVSQSIGRATTPNPHASQLSPCPPSVFSVLSFERFLTQRPRRSQRKSCNHIAFEYIVIRCVILTGHIQAHLCP